MKEKEMIMIVRAVRTCIACPSQWDAWDEAGSYYYLRYRHGHGEVRQYLTPDWADAPRHDDGTGREVNSEFIRDVASFSCGDALDGSIELEEFAERAGLLLGPRLVLTGYRDHLADELILGGIAVEAAEEITQPWCGLDGQ